MLNGRQCSGASTTGRTVQEFGDHAAFRSHHHSSRLPLPSLFKRAAKVCSTPSQPCHISRRQKLSLQASPGSRRHGQQRSWHSPTTACAATSAQIDPNRSRLPSLLRNIRTAVVLAAVFSIWCCISANTQPSSAFLSVTSALTNAGAPPAGGQCYTICCLFCYVRCKHMMTSLWLLTLQLRKAQSEAAMLALQRDACTLLQA